MASVIAINISEKKGVAKHLIEKGYFKVNYGLSGDAHGGNCHRQVSLLGQESIDEMKSLGLKGLCNGKFVENLTTEGIVLYKIPVGKKIKVGEVVLEVTQIGKECYKGCEIRNLVVNCIMSRKVIFARVLSDGWIKSGNEIQYY